MLPLSKYSKNNSESPQKYAQGNEDENLKDGEEPVVRYPTIIAILGRNKAKEKYECQLSFLVLCLTKKTQLKSQLILVFEKIRPSPNIDSYLSAKIQLIVYRQAFL